MDGRDVMPKYTIANRAVHRAGRLVWSTGDRRQSTVDDTWPRSPSECVVNSRPTTVAYCWHTVAVDFQWYNFSESRVWGKSPRGKYPYFWRYRNSFFNTAQDKPSFRAAPLCQERAGSVLPFWHNTGMWHSYKQDTRTEAQAHSYTHSRV